MAAICSNPHRAPNPFEVIQERRIETIALSVRCQCRLGQGHGLLRLCRLLPKPLELLLTNSHFFLTGTETLLRIGMSSSHGGHCRFVFEP